MSKLERGKRQFCTELVVSKLLEATTPSKIAEQITHQFCTELWGNVPVTSQVPYPACHAQRRLDNEGIYLHARYPRVLYRTPG